LSDLSLERITDTFNRCADGLFGSRTFDGEGVGRGTGLGFLYAWDFLDGTDNGGLAMTAMHVFNPIDSHIGI
jgi:hypothetical protein